MRVHPSAEGLARHALSTLAATVSYFLHRRRRMEEEGRRQGQAGEDGRGGRGMGDRGLGRGAGPLAPFPSIYCRFKHVVRPSVKVTFEPSERRGHGPAR